MVVMMVTGKCWIWWTGNGRKGKRGQWSSRGRWVTRLEFGQSVHRHRLWREIRWVSKWTHNTLFSDHINAEMAFVKLSKRKRQREKEWGPARIWYQCFFDLQCQLGKSINCSEDQLVNWPQLVLRCSVLQYSPYYSRCNFRIPKRTDGHWCSMLVVYTYRPQPISEQNSAPAIPTCTAIVWMIGWRLGQWLYDASQQFVKRLIYGTVRARYSVIDWLHRELIELIKPTREYCCLVCLCMCVWDMFTITAHIAVTIVNSIHYTSLFYFNHYRFSLIKN